MPATRDDDRSHQSQKNKGDQGQQHPDNEQRPRGNQGDRVGATSVNTSDPAVSSPEEMQGSPEQVVSFQTSQLPSPPPDYPFASGGDVVKEQSGRQKGDDEQGERGQKRDKGQEEGEHDGNGRQKDEQGRNKQNGHGERQGDRHRDDERNSDQHRRRKKKKKHQPAGSQPNWKTMAMIAVLALVCGVGGAWAYSAIFNSQDKDKQDKSSEKSGKGGEKNGGKSSDKSGGKSDKSGGKSGSEGSEGGASASEIPGFSSAKDADTFKKELEHLAHRLDLLGARIDRMTTNDEQTPPVLHTVQRKVTDLEREVDQVANLPSKMDRLDRKLSDLKQEFRTLKEQVTGSELPIASELAPAHEFKPAPLGESTADPADEATLRLAAGLLREGHHDQAYEVLRRLQRERPHDARVWYLSAVARGLSSGEWGGKTKQLAEQGIACEREGRPSREKIDAVLTDLTDVGKNWVAEQRREIKVR